MGVGCQSRKTNREDLNGHPLSAQKLLGLWLVKKWLHSIQWASQTTRQARTAGTMSLKEVRVQLGQKRVCGCEVPALSLRHSRPSWSEAKCVGCALVCLKSVFWHCCLKTKSSSVGLRCDSLDLKLQSGLESGRSSISGTLQTTS